LITFNEETTEIALTKDLAKKLKKKFPTFKLLGSSDFLGSISELMIWKE